MKLEKSYKKCAMQEVNVQPSRNNQGNTWLMLLYSILVMSMVPFFTGCKDKDPEANFSASEESALLGDTVYFTNSSSNADFYQWTFGDGDAAVTQDASHVYTEAGTYTVTLVAIGNDKSNSISKQVTVTGDITIFPGIGTSEISVGDTWATIKSKYSALSYVQYDATYSEYYGHFILYYNSFLFD